MTTGYVLLAILLNLPPAYSESMPVGVAMQEFADHEACSRARDRLMTMTLNSVKTACVPFDRSGYEISDELRRKSGGTQ